MVEPEPCKHMETFSIHRETNNHCRKVTFQLPIQWLFAHETVKARSSQRVKWFTLPLVGNHSVKSPGLSTSAQGNRELTSDSQQIVVLGYAPSATYKYKLDTGKCSSTLTSPTQNLTHSIGYAYVADSQVYFTSITTINLYSLEDLESCTSTSKFPVSEGYWLFEVYAIAERD